jgi:hypothetical protein
MVYVLSYDSAHTEKGQLISNSYMDSSQDRVYGTYGIAPMNSTCYRENCNMII